VGKIERFVRPVLIAAALGVLAVVPGATTEPQPASGLEGLPVGWYARILTSEGEIVARLHPEQAPQSVAHFAALAEARLPWTDTVTGETRQNHYYDGQIIYLASAGNRFETGCPHGTGSNSPRIFVPEEVNMPINFAQPWKLGLTRAPLGRISGAQFFVTAASVPAFNHRHPCFGTVVRGKETVFKIAGTRTYSNGRPIEPITLESVRILAVGDPEPLPEPVAYTPKTRSLQPKPGLSKEN
jgi:peptidyl-prolyl cis-trans isomerase A (cyclophilin A)